MMNRGKTLSFHRIPVSYWKLLLAIGLLLFLAGCGGDSQSTPPQQVSLTVFPDAQSLWVNSTQQFTATVTGTSNTAVTWAVSETNGGTIDASGLYTAPATAGTYHVIATSQADTTQSAQIHYSNANPFRVTSQEATEQPVSTRPEGLLNQ